MEEHRAVLVPASHQQSHTKGTALHTRAPLSYVQIGAKLALVCQQHLISLDLLLVSQHGGGLHGSLQVSQRRLACRNAAHCLILQATSF